MDTAVFTSLIAVCSSLGTLFLSKLFDAWRDKRELQERRFNNLFPERIKAHEDIVGQIIEIGINEYILMELVPNDMSERLTNSIETVDKLFRKHQIFASQKVLDILMQLGTKLRTFKLIIDSESNNQALDKFKEFGMSCHKLYFSLLETARKESGADFIDQGLKAKAHNSAKIRIVQR